MRNSYFLIGLKGTHLKVNKGEEVVGKTGVLYKVYSSIPLGRKRPTTFSDESQSPVVDKFAFSLSIR